MKVGLESKFLLFCLAILVCRAWEHQNNTHGMTVYTSIKEMNMDDTFEIQKVYLSNKGHIQSEFTPDKEYRCCQNTPKFEDDILTSSRMFYFSHEGHEGNANDLKLYATMKPYGTSGDRIRLFVNPDSISLDGKSPIKVHYQCQQIPEEYTHAIVDIEISNGLSYQYLKECHLPQSRFWIHFLQFLTLAKLAMTVLLVGSKMGKLKLLERIDENRFDYSSISFQNIIFLLIFASFLLVSAYLMSTFDWFLSLLTLSLSTIAFVMCLFLFPDLIDWLFGIEDTQEYEGSGHFLYQSCLGESLNVISTISLLLTLLLMISWYTSKNWILSNLLAICVSCALVKIFRFNSLYPAFLILLGFFCFDIFWVIVSPILFEGDNIIEEVLNVISFPLKVVVPGYNAFSPCATLSIFDIVIPTFYISFMARFGQQQNTNSYYLSHSIIYALSMGIVTCAMVYSESKHPILLYVIPFLFITTWIVAGIRGEWRNKLSLDSSIESNDIDQSNQNFTRPKSESEYNLNIKKFNVNHQVPIQNIAEFQKFDDESSKTP